MFKRFLCRFAVGGVMLPFFGCVPEEPDVVDTLTVQVPTGAGAINSPPVLNTDDERTEVVNSTPFGDFDATGIRSIIPADAYSQMNGNNGGGGSNGGDGGGGGDGSGGDFAALVVSGTTHYSGQASGSDHQVLEGGYPEIHGTASVWTSLGFDESQQLVGLSIPGFAALSPFAIEVTPVGEMVEYSGTADLPLDMPYVYQVTPRVWTASAAGFHGEFDVVVYAEKNGFVVSGTMTHVIDASLQGGFVSYSAMTDYDCNMERPANGLLFVAHQTLVLTGSLPLEE